MEQESIEAVEEVVEEAKVVGVEVVQLMIAAKTRHERRSKQ